MLRALCGALRRIAMMASGERPVVTKSFIIGDETLFRFDMATRRLEISANEAMRKRIIAANDWKPGRDVTLPDFLEDHFWFPRVREIVSLPRANGSFFLDASDAPQTPRVGGRSRTKGFFSALED